MIGMNAVFHIGATIVTIGLLYWVFRLQSERRLLADLFQELAFDRKRRLRLEDPIKFLERFCQALQIPFDTEGQVAGKPGKIEADVLSKVFVEAGINAVRCKGGVGTLEAEIVTERPLDGIDWQKKLKSSLGGDAEVKLITQTR